MNKLIQWSVNGASAHLAELENLAAQQQPFMICLQRCKLNPKEEFKLRNFNTFGIESETLSPGAGQAITLVHESAPMVAPVNVESKIPAVAVSVALPSTHSSTVTICNMHKSSYESITYRDLHSLISQLPKPFILMGNFYEDEVIESLMFANPEISLLNEENEITHLDRATGHFFVEDFTIATSDLVEKISWNTYADLNDSDHFPIMMTFPHESIHYTISCPKWLIDDANWPLFEKMTEIKSEHVTDLAKDIEFITEKLLKAGHAAIRKSSGAPIVRRRIPWWNNFIGEAVAKRKSALKELRDRRSIPNLKKYLKCCDRARILINRAQQDHWDEFTSSINEDSPMPSNWRKIHFIHGKNQKNPPIKAIFREKKLITKPDEIVDVFASHYSAVSSNANYSAEFLERKTISETALADFTPSSEEYYENCPISMRELDYCLQHHNFNSSAGPDEIHPMMLKYFHDSAKKYLLQIYNRIWCSGEFPSKWKLAMIIPTLKKGKEKTLPASYRPVALTSALAKVFEKIIQKRLMWVLESKGYWSDHQYGFRKQRSATQALVDLQLRVKKAFDEECHLYAVFFDLQTASDTVWRHQILMHLQNAGIRGRMGYLIQNFLSHRKIIVRIGISVSNMYEMENGLPQGSILSETLLLVALNDVKNAIKPPVNFSLFVDDLVITYESKSPTEAAKIVQKSINRITNWACERGFKFSAQKTTCLDFYEKGKCDDQPELLISGQELRFSDTVIYLGLTIDSKFTWEAHINSLKDFSWDVLGLLEKINNREKGGDQTMLLRVYTSWIKSRLDYGCLVFGSARQNLLEVLDSIQSRAIRIATGAYPTSPSNSLNSISGIFPLTVSRQLLSANFLASALSIPNLPLSKLLFDSDGCLHENSMSYLTYVTKNFESFLPEFCKFIENPPLPQIFSDPPPWVLTKPVINLNLTEYADYENPDELPVEEIREKFALELTKYPNFTCCFTDGSKTDDKVGAAFSVSSIVKQFRLTKQCSSFTAELVAIFKCLEYLTSFKSLSHFIIISDSLNALECLQDTYSYNPIVQRILLLHNSLTESDIELAFLWVPSHCGIAGNEAIDKAARDASHFPKITCQIYTSFDIKSHLKSLITDSWQQLWDSEKSSNQLVPIKPNVLLPASSPFRSKRESDILTRLRISHTGLTHSYLLMKGRDPPVCPYCRSSRLLIDHILTTCPGLEKQRMEFDLPSSLQDMLNDESPHIKNLFKFLDSLNILNRI